MAMITNDWLDSVSAEFKKPYYRDLYDFVKKEYNTHVVYPQTSKGADFGTGSIP